MCEACGVSGVFLEINERVRDEGVSEEVAFIWSGGKINFLKSLCDEWDEFVESGESSDECSVLDRNMREGESCWSGILGIFWWL